MDSSRNPRARVCSSLPPAHCCEAGRLAARPGVTNSGSPVRLPEPDGSRLVRRRSCRRLWGLLRREATRHHDGDPPGQSSSVRRTGLAGEAPGRIWARQVDDEPRGACHCECPPDRVLRATPTNRWTLSEKEPYTMADMPTVGLLVTMDAKPGKEDEVEAFLNGGLALVNQEPVKLPV